MFTTYFSLNCIEQVLIDSNADKDAANNGEVVDFRGNPVDKTRTGGWFAAGRILGA